MANNQQQGLNPQPGLNPLANPFNGPMGNGPGYGDGPGNMYAPPGNQGMMQPQGYGPQNGGYDAPQGYNAMPHHRYNAGSPHYQGGYPGGGGRPPQQQPPVGYNVPPGMTMRAGRHPMGGMPPGMGPNMGGGTYGMHPNAGSMGGPGGMMMERKMPQMGNVGGGGYNPHLQPPPPHMPPPPQQQPSYMMGPPPQSLQPPPMHPQAPMPPQHHPQPQRLVGPAMALPPPPPMGSAANNNTSAGMAYNARAAAPPAAAVPAVSPPAAVPSYKKEVTPRVILVTGFRRTGKTTVAKELAKQRQYEYVSLRKAEESEDGDDASGALSARLAPLAQLLQRKHEIKGIVVDDALLNNKFEPYYVHHLLERAGLHFDILVMITTQLSDLLERKVEFRTSREMRAHPESFEFGSRIEETNNTAEGTAIAVVDGNAPLEKVVEDAQLRVREVEMHHLPPLRLPPVTFVPHATLVTDPDLVEEVIAAESAALNLGVYGYDFPYVEPNFLLDYVQFVRHALLFKHYLLTPWIWGDKISLIGYDGAVYVHLPSYQIVFVLDKVPAALDNLLHPVAEDGLEPRSRHAEGDEDDAETAGSTAEDDGGVERRVRFSLEAVMLNGTIYVMDMMLMGGVLGARTLLPDRVKKLTEAFESLPPDCGIQLLPHYPVNAIETCLAAHASVARGVLFINPDGMQAGNYDSRNFIYASEERKTVQIRIWEGRQEEDLWVFKAYARENEDEVLITNADGVAVPVHILDDQVVRYGIDDGNIVECTLETDTTTQQQKGGGGGKRSAKGPSSHFVFQRRCEWQVTPTTLYYQSAFSSPPAWQTKLFIDACTAIRYESVAELS